MKYCEKCKINYTGEDSKCPLCNNNLTDIDGKTEEIFPFVPTVAHQFSMLFKLLLFAGIAGDIICVILNILLPHNSFWSLFVLGGTACFWLLFGIVLKKRNNIPKTILYQVIVISILAVIWDKLTGWHGWSLDYVVPSVFTSAIIAIAVIAVTLKIYSEDIVFYIFLNGFLGIVPVLFVIFGWVHIRYISLICVAVSLICISGLFIFEWNTIKSELTKRFHL